MSLAAFDSSRNLGEAIEIYYFRYGTDPDAFYAHTDAEQPFTLDGVTYDPQPLKRGKITSSQSLDKSVMNIQTTLECPVAELFRLYPPSDVVTVTVRRGHLNDPDQEFSVVFVGRIQQCKRDGRIAELSCVPFSSSIKRSGLRRHYQLTCPHVLYDQDDGSCKASKAAGTVSGALISSLAYLSVTLAAAWYGARDPRAFLGGMVEWDSPSGRQRRSINKVSSNFLTLSLNGPTTGLLAFTTLDVVLGCPHTVEGCGSLHNNVVNYGGMPYIPLTNPVNNNPFT